MGSLCKCSEPLEMTGLVSGFGGAYYNPNDSTTKPCSGEAPNGDRSGWAIARPLQDLSIATAATDPTMFAALPAGHSLVRALRGPEGMVGIMQIGHQLLSTDSHARVAMRYYLYFSPNFQFKFEGGCENTKFFEISDTSGGLHGDISVVPQIYGWIQAWTPALDCCNAGPVDGQANPLNITTSSWKGKWWRIEVALGNATGSSGFYIEAWRKNVTDNLGEEKILGTHVACPGCGPNTWSTQAATAMTPNGNIRIDSLYTNQYRQGACNGYYGWSHYLKAAWPTDSGQRIGPASEIEVSGSPPPSSPSITITGPTSASTFLTTSSPL